MKDTQLILEQYRKILTEGSEVHFNSDHDLVSYLEGYGFQANQDKSRRAEDDRSAEWVELHNPHNGDWVRVVCNLDADAHIDVYSFTSNDFLKWSITVSQSTPKIIVTAMIEAAVKTIK